MKRFLYCVVTLLEIAAVAGIFVIDHYAHAKLGMNRWLVYHNQKWEAALNPQIIFAICAIVLLVLLVVAVRSFLAGDKQRTLWQSSLCATAMLDLAFILFIAMNSTEILRGYYLMGLLLLIAAVLQTFKCIVLLAKPLREPKNPPEEPATEEERLQQRTQAIARWGTIIVLAAAIIACAAIPAARAEIGRIFALLSSGDIAGVADLIRSYGPWAIVVSFLLMVLQSLAAPVPAFLITFANAAVFGWWQGAILSWTSAMAGAALCFFIARVLGRDAVSRFVTSGALASIDRFFEHYGTHTILICRLLPFMSFDYVSYAAGLTGMSFASFFIATGIGQLPATIVYSYVGGMLTGSVRVVMTALLIMFALAALVVLVRQAYTARHRDLMDETVEEPAQEQ